MSKKRKHKRARNPSLLVSPPAHSAADEVIQLPAGVFRLPAGKDPPPPEPRFPQWKDALNGWNGPVLRLIDAEATEAAAALRRGQDSYDWTRRVDRLLAELRQRGSLRKLQMISLEWRAELARLEKRFPAFREVINYLRSACALAAHRDGAPHLLPILLCGDAGCGKSYFAETLAHWFGSGYLMVHLETAQANSTLAGSEEYWSNSRPGQLFNQLVFGEFGNPVVCLDEIDKVGHKTYDPLSSLYQLLEPGTARSFRDLSYPWLPPVDTSRVLWIATANAVDALPEPILSRFRVFHIAPLAPPDMEDLVRQIFAQLGRSLGERVQSMGLLREVVTVTAHLSPRRIRQVLLEAVGNALADGRRRVLVRDLNIEIDVGIPERRIGFI